MESRRHRIGGSLFVVLLGIVVSGRPGFAAAQEGRGASMLVLDKISVAGAERNEVSKLTEAGVITTEDAAAIVVNVVGELRGRAEKDGAVGVLLVPDVSPLDQALRTRRILLVALEASAHVSTGESSYFVSKQQRFDVGFPRYRVLLYNSTGAFATASVFVNRIR
jgi:hypothetical protein